MKIWTRLDHYTSNPEVPLILALGNFDGVHLGHEWVLKAVVEQAKRRGGIPAVFTFWEHPQRVLHHSEEPRLLTSPQHRLFLFEERGIQVCFLLHFSIPFSQTEPEAFVEEWLVKRLKVREVHLGYNAHFGLNRRGNGALMRKSAARWGFDFFEAEPVKVDGEFVSSSLIRKLIQEGNFVRAARFLGRPFSLFASVVRGKGRGKELGFPTANLKPHSEILPPRGVYPVEVRERTFHLNPLRGIEALAYEKEDVGEWRQGILNYGVRPTFDPSLTDSIPEVFLFDFTGDLYGKTVEVVFHPRLREERPFQNSQALVQAIQADVKEAKRYFTKGAKLGYTLKGEASLTL